MLPNAKKQSFDWFLICWYTYPLIVPTVSFENDSCNRYCRAAFGSSKWLFLLPTVKALSASSCWTRRSCFFAKNFFVLLDCFIFVIVCCGLFETKNAPINRQVAIDACIEKSENIIPHILAGLFSSHSKDQKKSIRWETRSKTKTRSKDQCLSKQIEKRLLYFQNAIGAERYSSRRIETASVIYGDYP